MTKANNLGKLIFQTHDEHGAVDVYDDQHMRYLTFGNSVEQSCMDKLKPYRLEHSYTQTMLLGLLLGETPVEVAVLGLGGGSLIRALHHLRPKLHIDAIDYRQSVIDVAKDFFFLPETSKVKLYCNEAEKFLEQNPKNYNVMFSDLYLADKVHQSQQQKSFYDLCHERLTDNGLLVINQWSGEFEAVKHCQSILSNVFKDQVYNLHVQGGNHISFAFKGELPDIERKAFFEKAQSLGLKLDIPLQKLSRNFWQQNAEAIKIKRYNSR